MTTKNSLTIHTCFFPEVSWKNNELDYKLNIDEIHVWRIRVSEHFSDLFKEHRTILNKHDLDKASRFYWEEDFKSFLTGRIVLRILLGRYLNIAADKIEFDLTTNKPAIVPADLAKYNLSYSGDYILISISLLETGIDVEKVSSKFDYKDILTSCFTSQETDSVQRDKSSRRSFYTHWTRKEALLKYTGQGIIDDLTAIPSLDGNHSISRDRLYLDENINLTSFALDSKCIGSVVYPARASNISFLEWS